jgi:hypothetical protein
MPPQQGKRLLDLADGPLGFGAHGKHPLISTLHISPGRLRRNILKSHGETHQ